MSLSRSESTALMVLAYFFLQTGQPDAAYRAVRALLCLEPDHSWARYFVIVCADAKGDYERVLTLTERLDAVLSAALSPEQSKALTLIRARALQKSGRSAEAQALTAQLIAGSGASAASAPAASAPTASAPAADRPAASAPAADRPAASASATDRPAAGKPEERAP